MLKKTIKLFTPPIIFNIIKGLIRFKTKYYVDNTNVNEEQEKKSGIDFTLVSRNKQLVDKYDGKSCFLIGCGPSIKQQKLSKLKGQNVIGLSTFYYHPDYADLNIIADIFTGYTLHKDNYNMDEWMHYFNEMYKNCKSEIFLHEDDYDFIKNKLNIDLEKKTNYYKTRSDIHNILEFTPSIDKEIYAGQNIAIFAIQIAISMGFKQIYLIGLDHDWIYRLINKSQTKFHESKSDFSIANQDKFSFWIKVYHKLWSDYEYIKKYAEKKNVKIINLTEGGVLDVFDRENFEDAISNSFN